MNGYQVCLDNGVVMNVNADGYWRDGTHQLVRFYETCEDQRIEIAEFAEGNVIGVVCAYRGATKTREDTMTVLRRY